MHLKYFLLFLFLVTLTYIPASSQERSFKSTQAILDEHTYFEEKNGMVAVEAEYFYKQSKSELRKWYHTSGNQSPELTDGADTPHTTTVSNKTFLEILPDTRVNHKQKLVHGENFSDEPGKLGILHYKVKFNKPGRYYVWARTFSTGSEDNGIHVGINDRWPEHGQRMQWCERNRWTWESKQRTKEVHCGVPHQIYLDITEPGIHDIQFSMREDGFKFDKFLLTTNKNFIPQDLGPEAKFSFSEPSYFQVISTKVIENKTIPVDDFPVEGTGYYRDAKRRWLAINPEKNKEAQTTATFTFNSGIYDVIFTGVGENDGQAFFKILINDKVLGTFMPPLSEKIFEEGEAFNALWEKVVLNKGDKITVFSKVASSDGKEWSRARWSGIIFAPVGRGKEIKTAKAIPVKVSGGAEIPKIHPPEGRIAIVADGNSPDPDDLGATAVSIALLRATGMEHRLVHYSHCCDLVRVERISETAEKERHALMQSACDVTARRWGGFEKIEFLDAKWQQEKTVKDLSEAINASSKNDPLWIIEAGEPDIIGMALDASDKSKHQYVKVITHHPANDDAGDFYSWQQILDFGIEEVRIPDQNVNLKVNIENWNWAKNHTDPRIQWIWLQGKIAEVDDVVTFQKGKWDCSDAGMLLYWLTGGTNGGLEMGTVNDIKNLLLNYAENNL